MKSEVRPLKPCYSTTGFLFLSLFNGAQSKTFVLRRSLLCRTKPGARRRAVSIINRKRPADKIGPLQLRAVKNRQALKACLFFGGRGWIRTIEAIKQQIYSLPPLATRELSHILLISLHLFANGAGRRTKPPRFARVFTACTIGDAPHFAKNLPPAAFLNAKCPLRLQVRLRLE